MNGYTEAQIKTTTFRGSNKKEQRMNLLRFRQQFSFLTPQRQKLERFPNITLKRFPATNIFETNSVLDPKNLELNTAGVYKITCNCGWE